MATEANNVRPLSVAGSAAKMGAENRRYVVLIQLVLAIMVGWALANALELVWHSAGIPQLRPFGLQDPQLLGFVLAGAAFIYTMNHERAQEFANEVMVEVRKVTWPSWKETRQATIVVIIIVAIVAAVLGTFDLIWAKLIRAILTWGT